MAEALATLVAVLILLYFEIKQQKKILKPAVFGKRKIIITPIICLGMVFLFWNGTIIRILQIVSVIILLLGYTFLREGLGESRIITFGSIAKSSCYSGYSSIELIALSSAVTEVVFKKGKTKFSMVIQESKTDILLFFENSTNAEISAFSNL